MSGRRTSALLVVLIGGGACLPGMAAAQGLGLRLERGEVGVDGRGRTQTQEGALGGVQNNFQQWIRVPVSGFLMHPNVLRYSLAVRPLFGQYSAGAADEGTRTQTLGLDGSLVFFQARRLNLTLQGTKASGTSTGSFSTESTFENEDATAILKVRSRYFPTTVTYSSRSVRDRWRSAFVPVPIDRDQRASRLRAETRNRKLTTVLERVTYRDLQGSSDHEAVTAQARHRTTWGKGSSLVSLIDHYDRSGTSAIGRTSWAESLTILHTSEVASGFSFARQGWSRNGFSGRNLSYDGTLRYDRSMDFGASVALMGQDFTSDLSGGVERYRISPSVRYTLRAGDVRLGTSGTLGTEKLSRSVASDAPVEVIEEAHQVDAARVFALEQLRAEPMSIEIWDEARTLLLQPDVDYRVITTGPLVEIQVLPGSRVDEGEIVLVSYRYRSLSAEEVGLFYMNYDLDLTYRKLSIRHGRRQRTQEISGPAGGLANPNDVELWIGARLSGRTPIGAVTLDVMRRERSASVIDYTADDIRAEIELPPVGSVESRLRLATSRTAAEGQRTRNSSAGATASWPATRAIRVTAGLDGWVWERDDQHPETFLSGNVMMTWRFGQVNAVVAFDQVYRSNGTTHRESRWSVRVVRRF